MWTIAVHSAQCTVRTWSLSYTVNDNRMSVHCDSLVSATAVALHAHHIHPLAQWKCYSCLRRERGETKCGQKRSPFTQIVSRKRKKVEVNFGSHLCERNYFLTQLKSLYATTSRVSRATLHLFTRQAPSISVREINCRKIFSPFTFTFFSLFNDRSQITLSSFSWLSVMWVTLQWLSPLTIPYTVSRWYRSTRVSLTNQFIDRDDDDTTSRLVRQVFGRERETRKSPSCSLASTQANWITGDAQVKHTHSHSHIQWHKKKTAGACDRVYGCFCVTQKPGVSDCSSDIMLNDGSIVE